MINLIKKRCYVCERTLPAHYFYKDNSKKDRKSSRCRECEKERKREYPRVTAIIYCVGCGRVIKKFGNRIRCKSCAEAKKATYRVAAVKRSLVTYVEYRDLIKKEGCVVCGYDKYSGALDLHHVDSDRNGKSLGSATGLKEEIENKCIVVLCSNCHREVHAGVINSEFLRQFRLKVA